MSRKYTYNVTRHPTVHVAALHRTQGEEFATDRTIFKKKPKKPTHISVTQ